MPKTHRIKRLMRDFGRRLRAARITAGYEDASDFAADLGVEAAAYRKYERGESIPRVDVLESIADLTEHSLDWLLLGRSKRKERNREGNS